MKKHLCLTLAFFLFTNLALTTSAASADEPFYQAEFIFPLHGEHNHAPGIVQCANGDLLASWYRGSGERRSDDVAVFGARKKKGAANWSKPFLMADTPGFPDCNTCMMIDHQERLWLFWPVIIANSWESCLTLFKVAEHYTAAGAPKWSREGVVLLKPDDFSQPARKRLAELVEQYKGRLSQREAEEVKLVRERLDDKLYQRLGWQPRCKPTILPSGRILLPLYTDTFSLSIMAISDDAGKTWTAGQPTLGFGAIQPTVLRRDNGVLVAYMRENGPGNHIRMAESKDEGVSWGPVTDATLHNPGSGLDGVRLANGTWLLVYNDTTESRNSLAVSLSDDEGKSWKTTRHLEKQNKGSYHYPVVIQGRDGTIQVVYSYFVAGGKTMKHARFNEAWVWQGDESNLSR